jgi:hypothetical protein
MLSREKLTHVSDDELAGMLDEIMDFETTGVLQPGAVRELVQEDAKCQSTVFSAAMVGTVHNVFREAALRWDESRN